MMSVFIRPACWSLAPSPWSLTGHWPLVTGHFLAPELLPRHVLLTADNHIELQQAELMIDWCAGVLDTGAPGTIESSMTKVSVSEALFRIADRCVQVMGGTGVTRDTVVELIFRELRAFRIYDGPSEVHRWSLAKNIKRHALNPTQS